MSGLFSRVKSLGASFFVPLLESSRKAASTLFASGSRLATRGNRLFITQRYPASKKTTLTAFKTCPSRDGFAWRVKMPTRLILFLLFLI